MAPAAAGTAQNNKVKRRAMPPGSLPEEDWDPRHVSRSAMEQFAAEWEALQQEDLSSSDYYFNSYAHFSIHEEMLKDRVRTGSYQAAILNNRHIFKDKIVLDVGSGTGILCLFAAKAGAKHVYGIECSEIVEIAKKIASANNFDDTITFIKGKAEEVELPVPKVDIIISEWMGYFLLYESMLDTVLLMRDKYLAPDGFIFPDKATLHIAAIEDGDYKAEKIGYWENVYGFDYSCVKKCVMEEPIVDLVDYQALATNSCCILELNLKTCKKEDLDFCAPYQIRFKQKDFAHAMVVWFDICFSACHKPVIFTTSPMSAATHWKQTVFYIEDVLTGHANECISGLIAVRKNMKNPRDLDIKMSYTFNGKDCTASNTHYYRLR